MSMKCIPPLTPFLYSKLGFTGVYIFFLFFIQRKNHFIVHEQVFVMGQMLAILIQRYKNCSLYPPIIKRYK